MSKTGRVATGFAESEELFRIDTLLVTALEVGAMETSQMLPPPALGD